MFCNYDNREDIVLIVEDTAANQEVMQTFLNDIGIMCEIAHDGMEAVTLCSSADKSRFSLILMDIHLPRMNGFETAKKLRDMGIAAPIIAITAAAKNDSKITDRKDVFDAVLFKPFNGITFYTAISPYIRNALTYTLALENIPKDADGFSNVEKRICDAQKAVQNMGNSVRLFVKHFNNFKSNHVDLSSRLQALIDGEQYAEAADLCHSIKGLAGMLCLTSLCEHIVQLEAVLNEIRLDAAHREVSSEDMKDASWKEAAPGKEKDTHRQQAVSLEEQRRRMSDLLARMSEDIRQVCQIQF